jgi:hypothetical protein
MKRSLYFVLLLLVLLQACSASQATELPTATSVPTDTPLPTLTSLPTDSPTPEPTSTPDLAATAAVQSTSAAQTVLGELDSLLRDTDIPYQNGHLEWQQGKPLMVSLKGPSWDYVEIDDDLVGKNFILKTDLTWEATGILVCSAIFRSDPDLEQGKQYRFSTLRFSGLPAWEIAVFEYSRLKSKISKTQFSDAINLKNGATNQLVLVAQGSQFDVYINDVHQGRYYDTSNQLTEGNFAFSGEQDSGKGSCKFENSWIWTLE